MEEFQKALNYSYLLLKYRLRSRHEFIYRLKKKKFSPKTIEKVLADLEEKGYINDAQFIRLFINASYRKGWGEKRIYFSLKKLGINSADLCAAKIDKNILRRRLREIIERKIKTYKKNKYQKILRYLSGRGFSYEDIICELDNLGVDKFK